MLEVDGQFCGVGPVAGAAPDLKRLVPSLAHVDACLAA